MKSVQLSKVSSNNLNKVIYSSYKGFTK